MGTAFALQGEEAQLKLPPKAGDLPEPVNDPKALEVIDRYLKALGGKEALNGIEDKTLEFETIKHSPTGQTTANLKLFRKKDWRIREEWDIPGFNIKDQPLKFVQVYNGLDGWVQMFGTVSPLEGRTLSIFVWDKPIANFFCTWKEDGYSVTYVNESTIDNEPVDVIQTSDFTGKNKVRYSFSKKTGLLLKKEWREQGRDGYVKKEDHFGRYRDITFSDGSGKKLKFALHHKIFEDGEPDTERNYLNVTVNTGLKDEIFQKPKGIDFKPTSSSSGGNTQSPLKTLDKAAGSEE